MSISEYLVDGGYVPGLSEYLYDCDYGCGPAASSVVANRNKIWKDLCQNPRWKHNKPTDDTTYIYFCGSEVSRDANDYYGKHAHWKTIPVPEGMHDRATAPHFVWENTPIMIEEETDETYLRRLICVLDGRFVCMIAADEEKNNNGVPEVAERYRWRYWDNDKNVYQDVGIKWTSATGEDFSGPSYPGNFESHQMWMFSNGWMVREFWDVVWKWTHEGSSGCPDWDEALNRLARQASVNFKVLNENRLDSLAAEKGWKKIESRQPHMASYGNDDRRINFYLTTATAGTCLDHPTQGKTQLFRRGINMEDAAALLANPRRHTGRGYKRKHAS